jgi:hypothetical protein
MSTLRSLSAGTAALAVLGVAALGCSGTEAELSVAAPSPAPTTARLPETVPPPAGRSVAGESIRGSDGQFVPPASRPDGSFDLSPSATPGDPDSVAAEIARISEQQGVRLGTSCADIPPAADFNRTAFRPALADVDGVCRVAGWVSALGAPFTYDQDGAVLSAVIGSDAIPDAMIEAVRAAVARGVVAVAVD